MVLLSTWVNNQNRFDHLSGMIKQLFSGDFLGSTLFQVDFEKQPIHVCVSLKRGKPAVFLEGGVPLFDAYLQEIVSTV